MTQNKSFERFLADHLADDGSGAAQADRISARIYDDTDHVRQRPRWLALIKEPPMRISSQLAVGSPTARVAAIMVATLLIAIMVAGVGIAGSRLLAASDTIVVDQNGGGDYTTITAAVAVAEDGDDILVMPGTYEEDGITITKDITLRGDESGEVVIVPGTTCELDPRTTEQSQYPLICSGDLPMVVGPGGDDPLPFGVLVDSADAEVAGITVASRDGVLGFVAFGGAPTFSNVVAEGVYVTGGSSAEISGSLLGQVSIEDQSPARVIGNTVEFIEVNTDDPLPTGGAVAELRGNVVDQLVFAGPVTIADNTFTANPTDGADLDFAIVIKDGEGWTISDNNISGYLAGIWQVGGDGGDVLGNTLANNADGMSVTIGPDYRVASNIVEGGRTGIRVGGSGLVQDNDVTGAEARGIFIPVDATVTLTGNTSCGNGQDLLIARNTTPSIDDTNTFCDQAPADG